MKPLDPRLLRRSRSVRRHLALSVVLGTITAIAIVVQAVLVARLVAVRFDEPDVVATITGVVVALVACFALRASISWAHESAATRAAVRVKSELRSEVVHDLLDPRRLGARPESGSVVTVLGPGLDAFDGYIGRFLPQVVLSIVVPGWS